ncbi:MAG: ribosomal subunit interface protein [Candidatus Zambryskibacteria bacterium CG_4_9_14_3_um_filter_42_9]|nr:MAG: ribosomal subunit interface protein [Candidatus Zambryskibacteria bacterium CG_4_9_14_3_um_filter_42_9]
MKINIKATTIELTPAIADYVHRKISPIEKYLKKNSPDIVAQVEVGKTTRHHKTGNVFRAEVHIIGDGLDIYAVSEKDDLYAAIDIVKDEIMYNMVQSKGKRLTLARRGAEMIKDMMKGLGHHTARGFSWGIERLKFKSFKKKL